MTTRTDPALTVFAAWQEADARFRACTGPDDCEAYREIVEAESRTLRAMLDARATTPNRANFQVIGLLEERLPTRPIYQAEWVALDEGRDPRKHIPFGRVEQMVPIGFGLVAVLAFTRIARCSLSIRWANSCTTYGSAREEPPRDPRSGLPRQSRRF